MTSRAIILVLALLACACASYTTRGERLRGELLAGRPEAALEQLGDEDGERLPLLMERGLLAYLSGDWDLAQSSFAAAETVIQDLYTRSLSREAGRLVINDAVQAYRGEEFERLYVHFYRALAYLAAGEKAEAAVEGRGLTHALNLLSDRASEGEYADDPFLRYMTGLLYEADGEINDAWISYQRAAELYGSSAPKALVSDLLTAGERLHFTAETNRWRQRWPAVSSRRSSAREGSLVLLLETGLVPRKDAVDLDFPICEDSDEDDWEQASRAYGLWVAEQPCDVDYWLRLSLPRVGDSPALPEAEWRIGDRQGCFAPGVDLGALARRCLEERYAGVMIRSIARALTKYKAARSMEERQGKGAGLLVNLIGAVTEQADTRCWSTLPAHIAVARISLPAGSHDITVRAGGEVRRLNVDLKARQVHIQPLRIF